MRPPARHRADPSRGGRRSGPRSGPAAAALALAAVLLACGGGAPADRPNFILILADDLGWGTTSIDPYDPAHPASTSDFFRTPNLERLAAAGMRFTQAYAPHPNCSPSRASIQTGRSPAALHMTDNLERNAGPFYQGNRLLPPRHRTELPAAEETLAELLKEHDPRYRTAHFGKWHLEGGGPAAHGYDAGDGATGNAEGNLAGNLPDDPKQIFGITRRAVAWMRTQAAEGRPFYLQVSHYATHRLAQARPQTRARFETAEPGLRHNDVPFASMLHDLDRGVGELVDAVEALGLADDTWIVFTSDNGTYPTDDPGNVNGPVRGFKTTLWEGGVRVPWIVVGPGVPAGSVSRTPVIGWDLLPTVLDLAGRDAWPEAVEGGSLRRVLTAEGPQAVERPRRGLFFHWPHYQHRRGSTPDSTVVDSGWKLHLWWEPLRVSLFHLEEDLDESEDRARARPARADALRASLETWLEEVDAQLPRPNPRYDPRTDPARMLRP